MSEGGRKMKKIVVTILASLLMFSCNEEGGSTPGSSTGNGPLQCDSCGSWISRDINNMGEIAKAIIQNDTHINELYNSRNELGLNGYTYTDSVITHALRAYVNANTKKADGNGVLPILTMTAEDAFNEAIFDVQPGSRGVDRSGLCQITADVFNSFGIDLEIVQVTGDAHELAPDGNYCVVEIQAQYAKIAIDPLLSRSLFSVQHETFDTQDIAFYVEQNRLSQVMTVANGYNNVDQYWPNPRGYYHTYESTSNTSNGQIDAARSLLETTFISANYVPYNQTR